MSCPFCRRENPTDARSCEFCGRPLVRLAPGSLVSTRYEILEPLGAGGMGVVFKAHDRSLQMTVALKLLRVGSLAGEAAARFRSEIKLARKVRHRNVCGIHEYGEDGDLLFISMDLVEGRNLKQLIREAGPLEGEEAYDVALQATEGLAAIHEAGVIHRDLKTANIMRDARGRVLLMDFGIAKLLDSDQGLTQPEQRLGSPEYMSPEQVLGRPVDARSDIYSMGIVIFELFTGRVPFHLETAAATMLCHVKQEPPLDAPEAARIPTALVSVLRRALAKDPAQRHASSPELIAALREARAALGSESTEAHLLPGERASGGAPARDDTGPTRLVPREGPRSPHARLLVPALVRALSDPDENVRSGAAAALGRTGPGGASAAAALARALADAAPTVRVEAARALGRIGASDQRGSLEAARQDLEERVRLAATEALGLLGEAPAAASIAEAPSPLPPPPLPAPPRPAPDENAERAPVANAGAPKERPPTPALAAHPKDREPRPREPAPVKSAVADRPRPVVHPIWSRPLPRWVAWLLPAVAVLAIVLWIGTRWPAMFRPQTDVRPMPTVPVSPSTEPETSTPPMTGTLTEAQPTPTIPPAPTTTPPVTTLRAATGTSPLTTAPTTTTVPTPLAPTESNSTPPVNESPLSTMPAEAEASPLEASPPAPPPTSAPIVPPALISEGTCDYPPVAAALRLPGTVVLRLVIDEAGKVVDAQVVQKAKPFTEAARKCVEAWRYRPATRGGIPTRVSLEVPITFRPPP